MHKPITVAQLISKLGKVKKTNGEVVVKMSSNIYDVIDITEDKYGVILHTRHVGKRDLKDPVFDGDNVI